MCVQESTGECVCVYRRAQVSVCAQESTGECVRTGEHR